MASRQFMGTASSRLNPHIFFLCWGMWAPNLTRSDHYRVRSNMRLPLFIPSIVTPRIYIILYMSIISKIPTQIQNVTGERLASPLTPLKMQTRPVPEYACQPKVQAPRRLPITLLTVRPVLRLVMRAKSATIAASSLLLRAAPTSRLRRATTPSLTRDGCFSFSGTGSLNDLVLDILPKD